MWYENCQKCKEIVDREEYEDAYDIIQKCFPDGEDKEIVRFYAATICYHSNKIDEAISHWIRLLEINPDFPHAHYGLAACYGKQENLKLCFKYLEYRFGMSPTFMLYHQRFKHRHWDGKTKGESIYVYNEQGIGDMIQALRFLSFLKKYFNKVVVEAPWQMNGLITSEHGSDLIMPRAEDPLLPPDYIDYGVSINSLAYLLNVEKDQISLKIPYILPRHFNNNLFEVRRLKLKETGYKIGVCWAGSKYYLHDRFRSGTLMDFLPLMNKGHVYNLSLNPSPFINFDFKNLQETANVIYQLDLVITVDTAVAHLAGAMNKPTWLLLGKYPDWRWGTGESSYWYPSIKIFRDTNFKVDKLL